MAIILTDHTHPAKLVKSGFVDGLPISAGQKIQIRTSPPTVEHLDVECPTGKHWHAKIVVELIEESN